MYREGGVGVLVSKARRMLKLVFLFGGSWKLCCGWDEEEEEEVIFCCNGEEEILSLK